VRWQDDGDFSIIPVRIIAILPWNAIDPIDFHFVLIIDCEGSNESNPSRVIPEIYHSIIDFNFEWIALMRCAGLLPVLTLEIICFSIFESFGFMFNNPPLWRHQITRIFHQTYLDGFLGIVVSMLTGNWEGITLSTILNCFTSKVLDFLLLCAGNKWTLGSLVHFCEAIGVVHPESSITLAGMFSFPQNEINISISGLLPDLGSGGTCFSCLGVIECWKAKPFIIMRYSCWTGYGHSSAHNGSWEIHL